MENVKVETNKNFTTNADTILKRAYDTVSVEVLFGAGDSGSTKASCRSRIREIQGLLNHADITPIGKQNLIIKIENRITGQAPAKDAPDADKKLHAEKIKFFQAEVNKQFGYPLDNPWQDTLSGIKPISSRVSGESKPIKMRGENIATASHLADFDICTASYVAEKKDGTRVIAVVSAPEKAGEKPEEKFAAKRAAKACRAIAQQPDFFAYFRDSRAEPSRTMTDGITDYAYLSISRKKGGKFKATGVVEGNATVIAFHPSFGNGVGFGGLRTLETKDRQPQEITSFLPESSIVLCLTGDILKCLPCLSHTNQIDFQSLFQNQEFELPSNLNESTLMTALANHAAKMQRKLEAEAAAEYATNTDKPGRQRAFSSPELDTLFVVSLSLSNDLKLSRWSNLVNVPAWLLAITLGVVFGLSLFAAPALLAAAASVLMPLVFSFAILTGAAFIGYLVYGIVQDVLNQRDTRKMETPVDPKNNQAKDTDSSSAKNYLWGIGPRVWEWVTKQHPYQAVFGGFIALVMVTLASLALASILNPVGFDATTLGPLLQEIFNFIAHTLSGLSPGTFEVGSIASNVVVVLVAALIPGFLLNALRQVVTALYEKFKDESLSDVEIMLKERAEAIKGKSVKITDTEPEGPSHGNGEPENKDRKGEGKDKDEKFKGGLDSGKGETDISPDSKLTYAFTKENWTLYGSKDEVVSTTNLTQVYTLRITSPLENGRYRADVINISGTKIRRKIWVDAKYLDETKPVWYGMDKDNEAIYGEESEVRRFAVTGIKSLPTPPFVKSKISSPEDLNSGESGAAKPEEKGEKIEKINVLGTSVPNTSSLNSSSVPYFLPDEIEASIVFKNEEKPEFTYVATRKNWSYVRNGTASDMTAVNILKIFSSEPDGDNYYKASTINKEGSELMPILVEKKAFDDDKRVWKVLPASEYGKTTYEAHDKHLILSKATQLPHPLDGEFEDIDALDVTENKRSSSPFHLPTKIVESKSRYVVTLQGWTYRCGPAVVQTQTKQTERCMLKITGDLDPGTGLYPAVRINSAGTSENTTIYVHEDCFDKTSKVERSISGLSESYRALIPLLVHGSFMGNQIVLTEKDSYELTDFSGGPILSSGAIVTTLPTPWDKKEEIKASMGM